MKFTIITTPINSDTVETVSAREVYDHVESKQAFADWFKNRVKQGGFTQDVDFVAIHNSMTSPPSKEYHVTLDMAKHLGQMERNEKGKAIRQYFIDREKESSMVIPRTLPEALRLYADEVEKREQLEQQLQLDAPKVRFAEAVASGNEDLRIGEYAKSLSNHTGLVIGPNKLMAWMREKGILLQGRDKREANMPSQGSVNAGLMSFKYEITNIGAVPVPYITGKGQLHFAEQIIEHFSTKQEIVA
ncbi:MAG: antA/AntB antirepressor family protein [Gammaproteobacteria bacterium SHHR-1]